MGEYMKCSTCKKEISEKSKFCNYCGEKVKKEIKVNYCPNCGIDLKNASKILASSNKSNKLNIIVTVVFVLLIIEVVFFFLWYLLF